MIADQAADGTTSGPAKSTPALPLVVSATLYADIATLRVVLKDGEGTTEADWHLLPDGLPPIELPAGQAVRVFVNGGGQIGKGTGYPQVANYGSAGAPVPDLNFQNSTSAPSAAGAITGDAIIDALSPAQAAKADVRDIVRLKGVPDVAMVKSKLRRIAEANGTTPDALIATAKSGG